MSFLKKGARTILLPFLRPLSRGKFLSPGFLSKLPLAKTSFLPAVFYLFILFAIFSGNRR